MKTKINKRHNAPIYCSMWYYNAWQNTPFPFCQTQIHTNGSVKLDVYYPRVIRCLYIYVTYVHKAARGSRNKTAKFVGQYNNQSSFFFRSLRGVSVNVRIVEIDRSDNPSSRTCSMQRMRAATDMCAGISHRFDAASVHEVTPRHRTVGQWLLVEQKSRDGNERSLELLRHCSFHPAHFAVAQLAAQCKTRMRWRCFRQE